MAKNSKKLSFKWKNKSHKKSDTDWIGALAKEASSASTNVLSKKERIEKRNSKKLRKEERQGSSKEHSIHPRAAQHKQQGHERDSDELRVKAEFFMGQLSQKMEDTVSRINEGKSYKERRFATPFSPIETKGKATKHQQLSEDAIQPRKKDYGGLGLARESLLIDLRDVSFIPKLEEEFAEHIAGFFGKQRTKAMKKQLDGNMLWRSLADKSKGKKGGKHNLNVKVDGKKLSDMSPDERVEAMIKLDMI